MSVGVSGPAEAGWSSLFWAAFRGSKNCMFLLDEHRRLVDVNGAYLQLLGYPRDALIGRPAFDFVIGGPVASEREWHETLRGDQFTAVRDLRRADGGQVTVEFAGHPTMVAGRPLVLCVTIATSRRGRRLPELRVDPARSSPLSGRELEIVKLIAMGSNGPEIATDLHIAHNTVRTHVRNAMEKAGVRSRAALVAKLLADGLLWGEQQ